MNLSLRTSHSGKQIRYCLSVNSKELGLWCIGAIFIGFVLNLLIYQLNNVANEEKALALPGNVTVLHFFKMIQFRLTQGEVRGLKFFRESSLLKMNWYLPYGFMCSYRTGEV